MHILVTGGAGFIGSHLVERLLNEGHRVLAIDNFDPFYDRAIKERSLASVLGHDRFRLFENDILDPAALTRVFRSGTIEMVIHLAAKAGVRPSIADPGGYYQTNVQGTLNLLECCREFKIDKFIFASSSSVYGNNRKVPFSESDPVDFPISPYAAAKKAAELLCHTYHHLHRINIYALRLFTVYGPRQRPDLAIHKFFRQIYEHQPVSLYGEGDTARDYTYIDDILSGIMSALKKVNGFEIINLGESEPVSLADLVKTIEAVSGSKVERKCIPIPPGDVLRTHADISKARKLLDYKPATSLREGIEKFKVWFEDNTDVLVTSEK